MLASQEPRDGDFVAYIEQLQRESAARIRAQAQVPMVELSSASPPRAGVSRPTADTIAAPAYTAARDAARAASPVLNREQVKALQARLARTNARGKSAAVLLSIGVALALSALMFDGGPVMLLIGIGLIVWAVTRLHALRRTPDDAAAAGAAADRARIAQIFGPRPPDR